MLLSSFNQAVILILISERIGYNILQMKIFIILENNETSWYLVSYKRCWKEKIMVKWLILSFS